jgi:hypothetical protein
MDGMLSKVVLVLLFSAGGVLYLTFWALLYQMVLAIQSWLVRNRPVRLETVEATGVASRSNDLEPTRPDGDAAIQMDVIDHTTRLSA